MEKYLLIFITLIMLSSSATSSQNREPLKILALSKTEGYRHGVIPQSLVTLGEMGQKNKWEITATEDSMMLMSSILKNIDVVIFLHTTGNILGSSQEKALKDFVTNGGGLVTLHSGTITENDWPWFVEAVRAIFTGHPPTQEGTLIIEDRDHPATAHFPDSMWITTDEWYSFDRNPRKDVNVLISINEASYDVGDNRWFDGTEQRMGDHPLVWTKTVGQGRVFQTALGHERALYKNSLFLKHLEGAILWAGKRK